MSSITLKVNEDTLNKMNNFYQDYLVENNNQYALFIAKSDEWTITAYLSKKVLFQGKKAEEEASIWESIQNDKKVTTTSQTIIKESNYYLESIGSDEVGTGDYFGPVVVVSTYLDKDNMNAVKKLNIDDSKKINDENIKKIAPTLFKILPYSLLVVSNEKYNEVMKKNMNLNKLKALLHKQAIEHLLNKINVQPTIIIDQFCQIHHFNQYVSDYIFSKKIDFHTKAESKFASVACASIMARYKFLEEMDKLSEVVSTPLLKGASNKVDLQGKELVRTHGKEILEKIAKIHFKNTNKILG